ncbi:MAG: hypothetical protein LBJ00_08590 [Planctomycetaceae bacterium]|jgi:hypothetical protein|nr:hypothetical protein [Planctomycetaceae bacterium]
MRHLALTFIACAITISIVISGCGKSGTIISGTVHYTDGEPLQRGTVVAENGTSGWFGHIKDGNFIIGDTRDFGKIQEGPYKVYIANSEITEEKNGDEIIIPTVEAKYTTTADSGWTIVVKKGMEPLEFSVERPKTGPFANKK